MRFNLVTEAHPMAKKEYWKAEPDPHDFPAAGDYLSLLLSDAHVTVVVRKLRAAPLAHKKAKNLLRASRLQLLPADDPVVARDLSGSVAAEQQHRRQ
jgi:hypothetical protein